MRTLRLLIPLDETFASVQALTTVRNLALTVDSCFLELLHVEQAAEDEESGDRERRRVHVEEFLARQAQALAMPRVNVSCQVDWGDPADVILRHAREGAFDFICMTTRAVPSDASPADSVALRLFRESPVPIIALPAAKNGAGPRHPRASFRAAVRLPAELEVEGRKHSVPVVLRDLAAKGAELETAFDQPLPPKGCRLIMTLPTRVEPLEVATTIVGTQQECVETGAPLQVLHLAFPTISARDQDTIVAFLNKLKMFEQQQLVVSAPVNIEVVTGQRAFANFIGHTVAVRPDYVWLHMERFDHIEGDDVTMRLWSPDNRASIEVDGTVTGVKMAGAAFDAEVELAEALPGHEDPGQKLMAFIRQSYPEEARSVAADAGGANPRRIFVPKLMRHKWAQGPMASSVTKRLVEEGMPVRAERAGIDVPLRKRSRDAERRALDSIMRPRRRPPPLRSI